MNKVCRAGVALTAAVAITPVAVVVAFAAWTLRNARRWADGIGHTTDDPLAIYEAHAWPVTSPALARDGVQWVPYHTDN